MNDTTPTFPLTQPLPEQSLAWLRHAAALGRAEPQALLHLLARVEALEAAAALPQPDKLDRLIEMDRVSDKAEATPAPVEPAALLEPPCLSDCEALDLFHGTTGRRRKGEIIVSLVRRIHGAGWYAAMAAVKAQREQQQAAEATPAPAPPAPGPLVQQLAFLIADFASTIPAGDATPTAIAVVRLVVDWLEARGWVGVVLAALDIEASRAEAELERQVNG